MEWHGRVVIQTEGKFHADSGPNADRKVDLH
jgi:hypothetical protein